LPNQDKPIELSSNGLNVIARTAVFECEPLHIFRLQRRLGVRIHQASQEACEKMDCGVIQREDALRAFARQ
jgi:hypothetical protein